MNSTTIHRDDVLAAAANELHIDQYVDYCINGMQVQGSASVSRIASAVSCSAEVFQRAADQDVDLLIVHHGLFWKGSEPGAITGRTFERLKLLLDAGITLAAYHLPLDGHPRLGNNAIIAERLGAVRDPLTPFALSGTMSAGCIADLESPRSSSELTNQLSTLVGREATAVGVDVTHVTRIAICSGGGASYLDDAHAAGAQVLITGEARENTMADAAELGMSVIAAGHWATETFGVQALGEHLAAGFSIPHSFISAPNPV